MNILPKYLPKYVELILHGFTLPYSIPLDSYRINLCVDHIIKNIIARHKFAMYYIPDDADYIYNIFNEIFEIINTYDIKNSTDIESLYVALEEILELYIKI